MASDASELARRLAREAEAVCRHYLSNGRREGCYWLVGDINNTPGRSLFVRLHASSKGPAGKWTDAATGEHGDLLDVIGTTCALRSFREIAEEARRFLRLPRWQRDPAIEPKAPGRSRDPIKAARRLFAMSQPLTGTLGEAYLANRGIDPPAATAAALRFHPQCFYRPDDTTTIETWPALIAAVTDLDDCITGVHRTWLDPDGFDDRRLGKAPIETPRRAMGDLLGHAVRFGIADDVMAAGEGIETMLSLRTVLPSLPVAAALSANHLATLLSPATLRRLYVAVDADAAGINAAKSLTARALDAGIEAIALCPRLGDFNEDLRAFGKAQLRDMLRHQLSPEDAARSLDVISAQLNVGPTSGVPLCARYPWAGERISSEPREPRRGLLQRRSDSRRSGPAMAVRSYFPPARARAFAPRNKIAAHRHPPLSLRPAARRDQRVLVRSARRLGDRYGRPRSARSEITDEIPMSDHHDEMREPRDTRSTTDDALAELQLYGYRPFDDEPDPRPLPEGRAITGAVADIFDALVATLSDTRLEPELKDLLWSAVNLFHRATMRIERELDGNEQAQRTSQREQNGSEVRSVELERLTSEGLSLVERRNVMELFRDLAAEAFELHTRSPWRPRSGSQVNHRTLTAAMIDSRDFLAAKRRAETEVMLPQGPKIALTGGPDFNDVALIWDRLDKVHAKHPDMVLLHGGSPKGAELIASKWAANRKVPQVAFKPDWTRHNKAAPFKRNDAMLETLPIGVMVFPGSGIQGNLADKARRLGIPVWIFGKGGA